MEPPIRAKTGAHAEDTPHTGGRLISERSGTEEQSGTSGVSDKRRAELEQLEAEAGLEHDAPDEGVPQRAQPGNDVPGLRQDTAADAAASPAHNPDIDKR